MTGIRLISKYIDKVTELPGSGKQRGSPQDFVYVLERTGDHPPEWEDKRKAHQDQEKVSYQLRLSSLKAVPK